MHGVGVGGVKAGPPVLEVRVLAERELVCRSVRVGVGVLDLRHFGFLGGVHNWGGWGEASTMGEAQESVPSISEPF